MDNNWTKGTVVNENVAAGRSSPVKVLANGIQGDHFLLRNMGSSPQSRAAMHNLRSSQPQKVPDSRNAQNTALKQPVAAPLNNSNS